jgi:hypothetical protein
LAKKRERPPEIDEAAIREALEKPIEERVKVLVIKPKPASELPTWNLKPLPSYGKQKK